MSSPLAIGAVTAVLRNLLDNGIVEQVSIGTISVTASAPDTIKLDASNDPPQLNVFLYQVTPNAAWRNASLPSRSPDGDRLTNQPLALDLHYLITAYGRADFQAEILLGYAMHVLHERPILDRPAIRRALQPGTLDVSMLPLPLQLLTGSDLADQFEAIRVTPAAMSTDEMSKLWSAIKSDYRPSSAYQVSVVLIERKGPAISPLPVLTRGRRIPGPAPGLERDEGVVVTPGLVPPYPTLESAVADTHATPSTFQLGDVLTVRGHHLAGTARAMVLRNDRFGVEHEIQLADSADDAAFSFIVPNLPADLPVGVYQLELRVLRAGDDEPRTSNRLPVALAPAISFPPIAITRSAANVLSLRIGCAPEARVGQRITLLMDTREVPAQPFTANIAKLDFELAKAPPAGSTPLLRLKVDGIESIVVNRGARPPAFFNHRITLPA